MLSNKELNTIFKFNLLNYQCFFGPESNVEFFVKEKYFIVSSNQIFIKDLWILLQIFQKHSVEANVCFLFYSANYELLKSFIEEAKPHFKKLNLFLVPKEIINKSLLENSIFMLEEFINRSKLNSLVSHNFILILNKHIKNNLFF